MTYSYSLSQRQLESIEEEVVVNLVPKKSPYIIHSNGHSPTSLQQQNKLLRLECTGLCGRENKGLTQVWLVGLPTKHPTAHNHQVLKV